VITQPLLSNYLTTEFKFRGFREGQISMRLWIM
jgi:hypothetical protein